MSVRILDEAERDLAEGRRFYEQQRPGLGAYFLDSLFSDIDSVLARSHAILGMLRNRSNIMRHQNTPVDNARERGIPKPQGSDFNCAAGGRSGRDRPCHHDALTLPARVQFPRGRPVEENALRRRHSVRRFATRVAEIQSHRLAGIARYLQQTAVQALPLHRMFGLQGKDVRTSLLLIPSQRKPEN